MILERAICPVDPDSPISEKRERKVQKRKERSKKKGPPLYSPLLFAFRSPKKLKSPSKSPGFEKKIRSPGTPKNSKRQRSDTESSPKGSPASKVPKSARRHMVFNDEGREGPDNNVPLESSDVQEAEKEKSPNLQ